jgi:ubiquinone/menaquinone biosynthesis C-methylase UbiE
MIQLEYFFGGSQMVYSKWFHEIVCDPETGEKLERQNERFLGRDGREYRMNDGILSIVFPADIGGEDAKMNRLYNWIAPLYDFNERVFGYILTGIDMMKGRLDIVSRLDLKPGIKLLEVSPGPGVFQRFLRDRVGSTGEIVSLDLSMAMLRQCQKRNKDLQIQLVHGNGQYLPFQNDSFDAVFHFGGINLFNDPQKALEEFVRVTKKGGLVAWGDEGFSPTYPEGFRKNLFSKMNPGFLKPRPTVPKELIGGKEYEVYNGMAYLMIGQKA